MNEQELTRILSDLNLGEFRFFDQVASTNDIALTWATHGAPDLSLVVANEQTAGRGRYGRKWYTPAGSALACSLILHPQPEHHEAKPLFTALGALAASQALGKLGLQAEIKWPNDVLLNRKKVGGILAEAVWLGDQIESIVIGIGINVDASAVPPTELLDFPATSIESETGQKPDRQLLLHDMLAALIDWLPRIGTNHFIKAWQHNLAYRGELVEIRIKEASSRLGQVLGLENDGSLRLISPEGKSFTVRTGEVSLRPVDMIY